MFVIRFSRWHAVIPEPARRARVTRKPANGRAGRGVVLALGLLFVSTGCVTQFRTATPLSGDETRIVASDLAVGGVLARRDGERGRSLPAAAAHMTSVSGGRDRTAEVRPEELELLLASPSSIHAAADRLSALEARLGNRFVLVGEVSTAPTDELRSWIIQIVLPIPFIWISFGIPVNYASNPDVPHATSSARIIDLERAEIVATYFQVDSKIAPDEALDFRSATATRALQRMALTRR